jgi:hypothetical protein
MKHLLVLISIMFVLPVAVFAHGVEVFNETGNPGVQTVRFGYTDGEPMLFARVKVFSPSSPDAPVQESIADRAGYFSFIPFEAGEWRLTAEDGMGHKGEIRVPVSMEEGSIALVQRGPPVSHSGGKLPVPLAALLGVSLLLNVFAAWYFAGNRINRGKRKVSPIEADGIEPDGSEPNEIESEASHAH